MLTEICAEIRNWFSRPADRHFGAFTISGGSIAPLDFLQNGQYFRIVGSCLNDGVYKYPAYDLTDETFTGSVWAMSVPPALISLSEEIKAYAESPAAQPSAFQSESFAGYSYAKFTNGKGGDGSAWQTVYARQLNKWRKM